MANEYWQVICCPDIYLYTSLYMAPLGQEEQLIYTVNNILAYS